MNEAEKNFNNFIGIAQKAGKLKSGDNMVFEALKQGSVYLIILASDAADSVKAELAKRNKARVPVLTYADKLTLGEITGRSPRGMLGVCDEGFARAMISKYDSLN